MDNIFLQSVHQRFIVHFDTYNIANINNNWKNPFKGTTILYLMYSYRTVLKVFTFCENKHIEIIFIFKRIFHM